MKKLSYILIFIICTLVASGCTLPNLYDVDLPDQTQGIITEQPSTAAKDTASIDNAENAPSAAASGIILSVDDVVITTENNTLHCVNHYTSDKKTTFAWYIVEQETQQPIHKEPYQESNEFFYKAVDEGTFQIVAYIRQGDDRTSVIAGEYTYDAEAGLILLSLDSGYALENFTASDISVNTDGNDIILTNHFNENNITFAWYLIDAAKNQAVLKESYSAENTYKITLTDPGSYRIDAFIRNKNNERKSVIAAVFSFDGENITLE